MAGVRDHTELDCWRLSDQLQIEIYRITSTRGFRSALDLKAQLIDAAESATSNIAEGFSRYYPRDNARFVRIAKASLSEVINRLRAALLRGLITEVDAAALTTLARRARGACTGLILYLERANPPGREKAAGPRARSGNPGTPESGTKNPGT